MLFPVTGRLNESPEYETIANPGKLTQPGLRRLMLLQTNSYVVPKEKRVEHARLVRRFKQALARLGCDQFEVYEQVGTNWTSDQTSGRFVQILRFRDRREQLAVQAAERSDPACQAIITEFCELINYPYQQQQGLFAIGYYSCVLGPTKALPHEPKAEAASPAVAPSLETVEAAPPIAQEIQFGETPVQTAADEQVAGQTAVRPEVSPAGTNGEAAHAPEPTTQADAESLNELIKRRFGSLEITPPAEPTTDTAAAREQSNGESVSAPAAGSGISEVLNAVDDNGDFDFLLPAEPLDDSARESAGANSHNSAPDAAKH
jgi:hypothetical protein